LSEDDLNPLLRRNNPALPNLFVTWTEYKGRPSRKLLQQRFTPIIPATWEAESVDQDHLGPNLKILSEK
jgi:hypothetical protein